MASDDGITPVGAEIIEALGELRDALRSGEPLEKRFTVRTYEINIIPSHYTPEDVRRVRSALGMNQEVFATFLGVSPATVKSWETGTNTPAPIARRFMDEIAADPGRWIDSLARRGCLKLKA